MKTVVPSLIALICSINLSLADKNVERILEINSTFAPSANETAASINLVENPFKVETIVSSTSQEDSTGTIMSVESGNDESSTFSTSAEVSSVSDNGGSGGNSSGGDSGSESGSGSQNGESSGSNSGSSSGGSNGSGGNGSNSGGSNVSNSGGESGNDDFYGYDNSQGSGGSNSGSGSGGSSSGSEESGSNSGGSEGSSSNGIDRSDEGESSRADSFISRFKVKAGKDGSDSTHSGAFVMVASSVLVGALVGAVAIRKRRTITLDEHPLKGSIDKRMKLFSHLADHHGSRPPRRYDEDTFYKAEDVMAGVPV